MFRNLLDKTLRLSGLGLRNITGISDTLLSTRMHTLHFDVLNDLKVVTF